MTLGLNRRWLVPIGAFIAIGALIGGLTVVSGIVPVKASSGHWPVTAWFLQFAKRRSVATHTLGLNVPPLNESWHVLKGAAQYENACRPCHGSPALQSPRIAQRMVPTPPYLRDRIAVWNSAELFSMVKHGIKFTGMPAWPTQKRDDEVWAMVAFLHIFPSLDDAAYRRLVSGDLAPPSEVPPLRALEPPPAPRSVTEGCARCHGIDGHGRGVAAFPRLAGQSATYIELALRAFARGERHSGVMEPIAAALNDETIREVASYYAAAPAAQTQMPASTAAAARGAEIIARGIPGQQVPPCMDCHGPTTEPRNPAYPKLAGQYAEYLVLQLELFAADQRGGSPYAHIMRNVASRLTADQRRAAAAHFATLTPAPSPPGDSAGR